MKIVWRPMAEADRENIFDYIAQNNPLAAIELDEEFKARAESAHATRNSTEPGVCAVLVK